MIVLTPTRLFLRALAAAACLFAAACSGPDPLISLTPVDAQGRASAPLPSGARVIVRTEPSDEPTSPALSSYATPYTPDSGALMALTLENRGGTYFARSVSGAYAGQARELLANGLRSIQSRNNPDAFLLQFNNIGDAARQALQQNGQPTNQAVALLPALRRCTATTCALWIFRGGALRDVADREEPAPAAPAAAPADPAAAPAETPAPAPAPVRRRDYGLRNGVATTPSGLGWLWSEALAANAFRPGENSMAVFLYRHPGAQ